MNPTSSIANKIDQFQVHQIVCLEQDDFRIYSEVIQVISTRNYCWARPWLLIFLGGVESEAIDLRSSSDILLPLSLFRAALDTEVISFLTQLNDSPIMPEQKSQAQQKLSQCIKRIWQTNQHLFPAD